MGLSIPLKDFSFNFGSDNTSSSANSSESIIMKDDITLDFAERREDQPEIRRSWLFYPSDEHRIALSVRAKGDNQKTTYQLRFFNSVPLVGYEEVSHFSF